MDDIIFVSISLAAVVLTPQIISHHIFTSSSLGGKRGGLYIEPSRQKKKIKKDAISCNLFLPLLAMGYITLYPLHNSFAYKANNYFRNHSGVNPL